MAVQITIDGEGLSYTSNINIIQAAKIIGFLNTEEPLGAADSYQNTPHQGATNFIDPPKNKVVSSPREAIIHARARTNAQKILVLGAYIVERDGAEEFASTELKNLFIKAGESAPRNLSRDLKYAIKSGYITESMSGSDMYIVTNTGYNVLENGFEATEHSSTPSANGGRKSRKRRNPKIAPKPEWLDSVEIDDHMEGYPTYRQMNTKSDKALWIVQWATAKGRERVTAADITAVADGLADHIQRNQITATLSGHVSKSNVSKTADGYKILYSGSRYLIGSTGTRE
ncbi:hypothetical protein IPP75_02055 [Candidatus Saccharibacteria bacterium]|nr:MAG: hypothetical protein IPP75_02055 [Candidatus Saccharibacteria bacterium]